MAAEIVIFGTGQIAEVADFYFQHDSSYKVVAFTVDKDFLKDNDFHGRPVVPFENVEARYPPAAYSLLLR